MDVVHHGVIAAAGMSVLSAQGQPGAGIAFAAGSVLPDLDVLLMAFGRRFYLKGHQRVTHSLITLPLMVLFVSVPLWLSSFPFKEAAVAASVGLFLHMLLDLTNTYGISFLWPVSLKRFSLDAVFFIDATSWALTLLCSAAAYLTGSLAPLFVLVFSMALYFSFKMVLRKKVRQRLGVLVLVPGALNPFVFFAVREEGTQVSSFAANALTGREHSHMSYPVPEARHLELARTSGVFTDMEQVAKYLHITSVEETPEGTSIVAHDLGVRNFGGRFARTELKFDKEGRLVGEHANI